MSREIYMHIGFGKTGSTALQSFFNANPQLTLSASQRKLQYCVIDEHGRVSSIEDLTGQPQWRGNNYISAPDIAPLVDEELTATGLDAILAQGYVPLVSQEAWWERAAGFDAAGIFRRLDCKATIIAYVRPQVEWLNSAWWQWHAWDSRFESVSDVLDERGLDFIRWSDRLEQWGRIDGVDEVLVRLHTSDVVADFISGLDIVAPPDLADARENVGLSATHLKLLMRNPRIRGVLGAELDGIFSGVFDFDGESPWVMDPGVTERVIEQTRESNEALLRMLDAPSQEKMRADPRWWDAAHYSDRRLQSADELELERRELLAAVDRMLPALVQATKTHNELTREREQLLRERNELAQERNELAEERDQMLRSRSWRVTKLLRFINRRLGGNG